MSDTIILLGILEILKDFAISRNENLFKEHQD